MQRDVNKFEDKFALCLFEIIPALEKKRSINALEEGMFNKTQANDRNIGYFSLLSIQKPELVLIFFKYSSFSRMLAKSLISSASFSF